MHCAHFYFDLLGPHKGFLYLTECAHVHEFRKNLLTEFTVYLKIENVHWVAPPIVLLIKRPPWPDAWHINTKILVVQ